jgi:sterol desaturase/sphingolipid hydroxylase (fatty acid hydroxylase superfamily)
MSNLLSIWDRVFGTYVNPDRVQTEFSFGLDNRENPIRLILGV